MFAQVLAVATLALATLSNAAAIPKRAVTVDPGKWYTLSWDGMQYLDSTNSVLMIQQHNSFDDLNNGDDKGVRFRFPDGLPGKIVCEAHNDHFVGLAEGSTPVLNQFDTFQNEDRAATAEAGDKGIIIHFGDSYYGRTNVDGNPVSESEAQEWDVREISMVPL
ncbi:hypothetical protein K525DRAFT_195292 [Schizophyllum commune Loenen D]|nr:hypothetical protein K525DRAFT_195292 [Schizophyllum commune Loenen D]